MTRGTWSVLLLLVATNAAWAIAWWGREADPAGSTDALRAAEDPLHADAPDALQGPGLDAPGLDGLGTAPPGSASAPAGSDVAGGPPSHAADGPADGTTASAGAPGELTPEERQHYAEVRERVLGIMRRIMQVRDAGEREAGLRELGEALASTDAVEVEMALGALHGLRGVEVDRARFRQVVLDQMHAESPGVRRSALYALHATGAVPEDVRFVLAAVDDESLTVRQHAARVLKLYSGGRFEGAAAKAVLKLLADPADLVVRGCLSAMDGARVDASVERALIAMSRQTAEHEAVIENGLAPLGAKSREVIDVLFDALGDEDRQIRARAHWGLQRGVPESQQLYVATRYVEHLDRFINPQSHREVLKIVARHGDASLVPQLERFAENELVDPKVREMTAKVVEYLRSK